MMAEQYLVLFDADHIKEYVFATGRLKEIRGASDQVRQLTDAKNLLSLDNNAQLLAAEALKPYSLKLWSDGEQEGIIYASGGAGALLFLGKERAEAFCRDLERVYRQNTRSASLTAVAVPVHGHTSDAHARAQQRAAWKLAQRKASRPHAEAIPGGGIIRFCGSDRLYPASVRAPEPDSRGILVSEATAIKRLQNYDYRTQLEKDAFWQAFRSLLPREDQQAWSDAIHPSQDLGSIGYQARPRGYVALVYADGDGVGQAIRKTVEQHGFAGYQYFSDTLTWAATQATAQALADAYGSTAPKQQQHPEDRPSLTGQGQPPSRPPLEQTDPETGQRRRYLPFEVITIGGDDVILICTAERGLAVACTLSRVFSELVNQQLADRKMALDTPFSVSVGVVIAHDSLPMVQLERRGRDLLKSAKTAHTPGTGGVDFHIVTTPGLDSIGNVRKRDYRAASEKTEFTRRPYTLDQAERLLCYARYLRGLCDEQATPRYQIPHKDVQRLPDLPNSKLTDLYLACRGDRIQATLHVLAVHMRLGQKERHALTQALRDLESIACYPFAAPEDGIFRTALPDLLEASEFVAEEGRWES